jgi:hypothetical protein
MKKIRHIGNGEFEIDMEDGSIKECGKNMRGMIRYTYFEDYTLPSDNWEVEHITFLKDYHNKVFKDIQDNKFEKDENGYMIKKEN